MRRALDDALERAVAAHVAWLAADAESALRDVPVSRVARLMHEAALARDALLREVRREAERRLAACRREAA